MNALEPAHLCPLCNQENHCMAEQIRKNLEVNLEVKCWCFTAQISLELLECIPANQKDQCICSRCVEKFRLEENFLK